MLQEFEAILWKLADLYDRNSDEVRKSLEDAFCNVSQAMEVIEKETE